VSQSQIGGEVVVMHVPEPPHEEVHAAVEQSLPDQPSPQMQMPVVPLQIPFPEQSK